MDLTRINKVKERLQKENLLGMYITNLTNVRYLTGFTGSAGSVLLLDDENHFFTDGRYTEQVKDQVKNCTIHIVGSSHIKAIQDENLLPDSINIGFESSHLSYANFQILKNSFPNINWKETDSIIEHIAAIKDMMEIESLKTAIEITDEVFTQIIPELKIGAIENHIAAKISYLFKMNGAEGDSYDPIIASGYLGALPHARPSNKEFEKGDFVVMDFGALYNGYHADMTRTVLIGPSSSKHEEIYNIVLESQLNGIKTAKAGVPCSTVDYACRSVIEKKGYGDLFTHSTGHGIGLEVHTLPRIHKSNEQPLQANHVITIEPGIYIPNWGGVRIEDDCLIASDTCIPLNKSSKELIII